MKTLRQIYLEETGGRRLNYTVWLEKKIYEYTSAYDSLLELARVTHQTLLTGTEEERQKLAQDIAVGLKDTGLFDEHQPEKAIS